MKRTLTVLLVFVAAWTAFGAAQRGASTAPPRTVPPPPPSNPPPQRGNPPPQRGQAPPNRQSAPKFRSGIDLIDIDVAVLDGNRQPVRGLVPSDFLITEDRQPQAIVNFSEVEVPQPVEPPAVWMREVSPDVKTNSVTDRRLFVIVMDDALTQPNPPRTVQQMKTIGHDIVSRFGPSDLAAVIFTLDDRKSQDFTNDRVRLSAAIDRFSPGFGSGELYDRYPLNAIDKVAEYLTDLPLQRKALIYISPGVPVDMTTAASMRSTSVASPGGLRGAGGIRGGDPAGHASALTSQMEDIFRMAARANVAIYTVDPTGLHGFGDDSAQARPGDLAQDMLLSMAANTGGFAVVNANDTKRGIDQIFTETNSYYILGYQNPNSTHDGKFRKLDIKIKGHADYTVRSRSGYYAPKAIDAHLAPPPPDPLTNAIAGLVPDGGMQMRLNVTPFAIPGKGETALAIALGLRQPVPQHATKVNETIRLRVSAFDVKGKPIASKFENATLVLSPGPDDEVKYEVLTRMDLKPGHYQLRLSAYSASLARSGSIYDDVDVPDFSKNPISLSGVMLAASPAIPFGLTPGFAGLAPLVPTTQREFDGHQATAFMRVYQSKSPAAGVQIKVRAIDVNDAIVFEKVDSLSAGQFGADRAADFQFPLPLGSFKAGPYQLTFDAILPNGKFAHRDVQIFVR